MDQIKIFFIINLTAAISYSLPIPLYTELAYRRGYSESFVGFVFSIYSIANITLIPFTNRLIFLIGRYNLLVLSCVVNTISTVFYLLLEIIYNEYAFETISILARMFQGPSIELINILIFSLSSSIGEIEDTGKNLSLMETATSLGLVIGPLLAFAVAGVSVIIPFFICLIMNIFSIYMIIYSISTKDKNDLNQMSSLSSENSFNNDVESVFSYYSHSLRGKHLSPIHDNSKLANNIHNGIIHNNFDDSHKNVTIRKRYFSYDDIDDIDDESSSSASSINEVRLDLLKEESIVSALQLKENAKNHENISSSVFTFMRLILYKEILWTFLVVIIDYINQCFFTPVFTLVMERNYGLNVEQSSLILSIIFFVYFISLRYVDKLIKAYSPKYLLCFGLLVSSFALLMLNPVSLFPQTLLISIAGYCILNAIEGFVVIGSLIDFSYSLRKMGYSEYIANDTGSAYYAFAINISELFGPLLGGIMTELKSFKFTTVIIGMMSLFMSILYFFIFYRRIFNQLSKSKSKNK